jgi:hypothetical protein
VIETDLARRKNKGMLPRARRGNFYDLPGLLLITYRSLIKPVLKGTFSGEKERIGSKTIKKHDVPKTPYQRIMESKYVDEAVKLSLTKQLELLNPFELNNIMQMKLKKITRLR